MGLGRDNSQMDHLYLHSSTLPLFSDARLANAARTRENCVLSREEAVTPEDEARIRELPGLIATERDPEKIKLFAAELEGLLTIEGKRLPTGGEPRSS